jgi:NAD(P)-dependent dehydrogenase (short-subunit alcohol dehydrogenase family)
LGNCAARYLCERGWRVFAADISERGLSTLAGIDGISPVVVDVTDQASITAAFDQLEGRTNGLDGIVNFAGTIALGSVIEMDEATLFRVLNTNALGTYRINRTFFPLILKGKGRIVNMSSETGWQSGGPFNAPYAMSKHMIEAYSDSLRRELMFLDIPVIKVQPGPFKTAMVEKLPTTVERVIERSIHFKVPLKKMLAAIGGEYEKANDPVLVAEVVYEALTAEKPRTCYSVKPDPKRVFLERLPVRWADALIKRGLSG